MSMIIPVMQGMLIILLAPLVQGIIKNMKARLQSRRGPSYLQPYYDFSKLLKKDSVVSPTVSWIFHLAPYVYFATAVGAAFLVPVIAGAGTGFDNLLVLVYLFAVGRFFLAIASLDAGSSFGGMGGSREMFISVLVEPPLMLALFTLTFNANSSTLATLAAVSAASPVTLSALLAAVAFLIIVVAETGRIPVDNPDTHLELTMIHEGMVLEYSGRPVGLIFWASTIKQLAFLLLLVNLFIPWNILSFMGDGAAGFAMIAKVVAVAVLQAFIESSTNKIRLFRVPGLMMAAGVFSFLALMAQ